MDTSDIKEHLTSPKLAYILNNLRFLSAYRQSKSGKFMPNLFELCQFKSEGGDI